MRIDQNTTINTDKPVSIKIVNHWTASRCEEVISALWFIAAFTAHTAGVPGWITGLVLVKAFCDTITAWHLAGREKAEGQP